jgi:hypothetical protein
MAGLRAISGQDKMLGTLVRVISSGKQALDAVMLEMGRLVAESVMLMEREEIAGPDYDPIDPRLQKWAHEEGSIFLGDQKVSVTRPRLRHVRHGEVRLTSYERLRAPGQFSEELLEKILRGVSAQQYADTVITAAEAFGVSPSAVSRKLVGVTAQKLKEFQERSLVAFTPFAMFLDTIHRGGEAFLVALGVDVSGQKMALGFWQGSSENHEICEALFRDLERRGLALSRRILFVTDGGAACTRRCGDGSARSWCINGARFIRAGTCSGTWRSPTAKTPIASSSPRWNKRATPTPSRCCGSWKRGCGPRTGPQRIRSWRPSRSC